MVGTKTVSVKLDSRLYTALKTRAELDNSNVSDAIRSLLRSALAAEGLDLYGNEVAGFIRGVVDARMDVAALDIERKLDITEDRIAAVLSRPMTAAIMAGLMSADVLQGLHASLDDVPVADIWKNYLAQAGELQPRRTRPHRRGEAPRARSAPMASPPVIVNHLRRPCGASAGRPPRTGGICRHPPRRRHRGSARPTAGGSASTAWPPTPRTGPARPAASGARTARSPSPRRGAPSPKTAARCSPPSSRSRNDIAPGAGLDRLDAWQALVRSEWPSSSEMTGVPESRVEYYAAMHVNGTSHHVHILTVDRSGDWDSPAAKGKMEAARLEISSKAMAPLLREAYIERDLARKAALEAVARIDRGKLDIGLPPNGRIEAAHLRRFHPEASAALREALGRAASGLPALAGALERHRKAVERCADLKCLTGEGAGCLRPQGSCRPPASGARNAALRVIVPDRTPAREEVPTRRAAPPNRPRDGETAGSRTRHRGPGLHPEDAPRKDHAKAARGRTLEPADLRGVSHGGPGIQARPRRQAPP